MDFYRLDGSAKNIKEIIISSLEQKLKTYENQKDSDEYQNIFSELELVKKYNFSNIQNILSSDTTAFCWLNPSSSGNVFINVKNRKGYRYPLKNSCLGKME